MLLLKSAYTKHHPKENLKLAPPLGSTGAIKALRSDALDIAVIGRELPATDRQAGLKTLEMGRTPFIFVVNQKAPIKSIDHAQLLAIFERSMTHWPNGVPIRMVLRPPHDIDNTILRSMSSPMSSAVDKTLQREGMIFGFTDIDAVDEVEKSLGAISTSTLGLVRTTPFNVKVLCWQGVAPSTANLKNQQYPHFKTLYLATRHNASAGSQKFIQFIQSKYGRSLLEKNGFWVKE